MLEPQTPSVDPSRFINFLMLYCLCYYSCPISPPLPPSLRIYINTKACTLCLTISKLGCEVLLSRTQLWGPGQEPQPQHQPQTHTWILLLLFFKILLFLREGKGGRKRGGETSMCGCLSCTLSWGRGPLPRHVPWLGTEPVTPLVRRPVLNPLSHTS